jgi:hypothetical protein
MEARVVVFKNLLRNLINPTTVTLLVITILVTIIIASSGGDPIVLAHIGTRYSQGDFNGTEGYDGQFVYYIARNPKPAEVAPYLDVPAYRYQRILLPLLARLFSLGNEKTLAWVLVLIGIFSQTLGTWVVGRLFAGYGVNRWYALIYGLWVGFMLGIILDLPEPLAYALVAGGILAITKQYYVLGWLLLGLAVFAKEVVIIFVIAYLFTDLLQRHWLHVLGLSLIAVVPYALFQLWLWLVFGQPGIGSGGAMATSFEYIPFMGLFRIGKYSILYLVAMLVVFGPTIVWPSAWGVWKSFRLWLEGERNVVVLALLLNSLMIVFLPFSTFRETGGLLRLACGLVTAILIFAGYTRHNKVLNLSFFWMVLNVFLFKS